MISCDAPGLAPVDQALETLLAGITPLCRTESITLTDAGGRVLAETVCSSMNVPQFDNSAMDGYAVKAADLTAPGQLTLVGRSMAGHPYSGTVESGQCVRIMTGAVMPHGADTVVMQENAEVLSDSEVAFPAVKALDNVRNAGEDIATGQELFQAGHRLRAADIGLLASIGIASVSVQKRLTVALLATGDELVEPGNPLAAGQIYQSNSYGVGEVLKRFGCELLSLGTIEDSEDALRDAFRHADAQADVVMTTGGVSVGEADYTRDVLESLGKMDFWKLAIKPGKPFACGRLPSSLFIGLPGNPVSALVTLHQLALPMLRKLQGEEAVMPVRLQARAAESLRKRPGRLDLQRGVWSLAADGQVEVTPTGGQSSGVLSSMSTANCFIVLEQDRGRVEAGETVTIELFDGLLL